MDGTKGKTYKTVIETEIDELFILTEDFNLYVFPIEEVKNKSTLNICEKYEKYKVKNV